MALLVVEGLDVVPQLVLGAGGECGGLLSDKDGGPDRVGLEGAVLDLDDAGAYELVDDRG